MTDVEFLVVYSNILTHLILCKQIYYVEYYSQVFVSVQKNWVDWLDFFGRSTFVDFLISYPICTYIIYRIYK